MSGRSASIFKTSSSSSFANIQDKTLSKWNAFTVSNVSCKNAPKLKKKKHLANTSGFKIGITKIKEEMMTSPS